MKHFNGMLPDHASGPYQAVPADVTVLVLHARIPGTVTEHFLQPLPVTVLMPGTTVPLTHAVKPTVQMFTAVLIGIFAWAKAMAPTSLPAWPKMSHHLRLAWEPPAPPPPLRVSPRLTRPMVVMETAAVAILNGSTGAAPSPWAVPGPPRHVRLAMGAPDSGAAIACAASALPVLKLAYHADVWSRRGPFSPSLI